MTGLAMEVISIVQDSMKVMQGEVGRICPCPVEFWPDKAEDDSAHDRENRGKSDLPPPLVR